MNAVLIIFSYLRYIKRERVREPQIFYPAANYAYEEIPDKSEEQQSAERELEKNKWDCH